MQVVNIWNENTEKCMHCMYWKVSMKRYLYGKPARPLPLHIAYSQDSAACINPIVI